MKIMIIKNIHFECNHRFCTECIMHWFRQGHTRCPMCRNPGYVDQDNTNLDFLQLLIMALTKKLIFLKNILEEVMQMNY